MANANSQPLFNRSTHGRPYISSDDGYRFTYEAEDSLATRYRTSTLRPCSPSSDGYRATRERKDSITTAKALEIAKEQQNGQVLPQAINDLLERKVREIWARIQEQPTSYVLSREEFSVFTYFTYRYGNNRVAQDAVARFWSHFKVETYEDKSPNDRKESSGRSQKLGPDTSLVKSRAPGHAKSPGQPMVVVLPTKIWPSFICYRCCKGYGSEKVRDRHLAHDNCEVRIFRGHTPGARQRVALDVPRTSYPGNAEPHVPVYFRAIRDCEANGRIGLSLRQNDIIRVIEQLASGWWLGEINDTRGWFYCSDCEVFNEPYNTMAGASHSFVGGFLVNSVAFSEYVDDERFGESEKSHVKKSSVDPLLSAPMKKLEIRKTALPSHRFHGRGTRWDHYEKEDETIGWNIDHNDNFHPITFDMLRPSSPEIREWAESLPQDVEAKAISDGRRPNTEKSRIVINEGIRKASDTAGVISGDTVQEQDVNTTGNLMDPAPVITGDDALDDFSFCDSTLETSSESVRSAPTVSTLVDHIPLEYFPDIRICNGEEYTFANSLKCYIEDLTAKPWGWWPLEPRYRPLRPDDVRVRWDCGSFHTHSSEVPRDKAVSWQQISRENALKDNHSRSTEAPLKFNPRTLVSSDTGSTTISSERSDSESSRDRSSSAISQSSLSDRSDNEQDSLENRASDEAFHPPDESVVVDIITPSTLTGFVLFGVMGSKRLRAARLRLAQIDVELFKDDDSFFDEMIIQYRKLRGYVRWIFSIWQFHTCEFVMFHKANPNEVMQGPEELPPITNSDYRFNSSRTPPILSSVFITNFYGCDKACIKSQLDILSIFHECQGRNHCGKYHVLDRLPKRRRKWEIGRDEEVDEAWGINAVFGVSFYKVVLYHLLILAGPLISWGMWLRKWPSDWQNASVPFFAVVVLISLFWLPFAYSAREEGEKRKMD